jgi:hypothetical protein
MPWQAIRVARKPVVAFGVLVLLLFSGGLVSFGAAQDAKPGDSLYIAKRATEKTKLAFTFDNEKKAMLGLEFAGNRAEEIGLILSEAREDEVEREATVNELVENFKNEIDNIKSRLQEINPPSEDGDAQSEPSEPIDGEAAAGPKEPSGGTEADSGQADGDSAEPKDGTDGVLAQGDEPSGEAGGGDTRMFSAGLDKDDKGLQISEDGQADEPRAGSEQPSQAEGQPASTTMEIEEFLADNPLEKVDDAQELLHQAEDLLNQQDYEALIVKLDQAGEALSGVSTDTETEEPKQGEVKGDSETATSTGQAAPEAATSTEGMNERASTTAEKS